YQGYDIEPDAISIAKGLGGGFPIGAIVTNRKLRDVFQPGHHATTFGGTPLACAAALAVIETIEKEHLVDHARKEGEAFLKRLSKLAKKHDFIDSARGRGFMLGLVMKDSALPMMKKLQELGLLTLATAGNVVRFLPPLNVKKSEIKKALKMIQQACEDIKENE
ncbi:MAG: aminotransferase class III-fold pyridoxal phosphate-dependent enzyme, partial [Verrucomicrobiota bacterium]